MGDDRHSAPFCDWLVADSQTRVDEDQDLLAKVDPRRPRRGHVHLMGGCAGRLLASSSRLVDRHCPYLRNRDQCPRHATQAASSAGHRNSFGPGPGQFTLWPFTRRAIDSGLLPSMGSVGDCFDNAVIESF
jgi:hypothetical protein